MAACPGYPYMGPGALANAKPAERRTQSIWHQQFRSSIVDALRNFELSGKSIRQFRKLFREEKRFAPWKRDSLRSISRVMTLKNEDWRPMHDLLGQDLDACVRKDWICTGVHSCFKSSEEVICELQLPKMCYATLFRSFLCWVILPWSFLLQKGLA